MTTYSRNNAYLRFHYDESHPNAYGYLFAPAGGSFAPNTLYPWVVNLHGGGFSQPGMDEDAERDPSAALVQGGTTLTAIENAGACIIILEYPLGTHTGGWDGRGTACTKFPETWQVVARGIQFIKDQCAVGGIFEDLLDPADCAIHASSSGAMVALMTQWAPDSWGMFPRAPGPQVALGHTLPLATPRVKGLVLSGPPINSAQADPSRAISSSYAPLPVVVASPYKYRPRLLLTGTVSGTISVGDRLQLSTDTTINGEVYSISGGSVQYLVEGGTTSSLADTNVLQKVGATANTLTLDPSGSVTIEDQHGWYEVPQLAHEAMSPVLLLDYMTTADLVAARTTAIYASIDTNPSVQFQASHVASSAAARTKVANKYGVDDGYDIAYLAHKLAALGGFTVETYWGQDVAAISSPRVSQTVTGASNASPIVITVAEEHGIQTGDLIAVGSVGGNSAANGNWTATRVSATTFSLQGSTGNAAWTSGGVWCFRNTGGNYGSQSTTTTIVDFLRDDAGLNLA